MNCKVFIVRSPVVYSDTNKSFRTYIINPRKVRYLDYNPHFKKLDIAFDNGEKFSIREPADVESLHENIVTCIEQWGKNICE
jgi:hypothetical protein